MNYEHPALTFLGEPGHGNSFPFNSSPWSTPAAKFSGVISLGALVGAFSGVIIECCTHNLNESRPPLILNPGQK